MRCLSLLVLLVTLAAGCATPQPRLPPPPTPAEIVQMAKDGMTAEAIIQRIEALQGVYPLSASGLANLRDQGVPDQVIDYMQRTYVRAARFDEFLRTRDLYSTYGWPYFFGPYPYGWASPYPWGWRLR
jgi:hypothetical protein